MLGNDKAPSLRVGKMDCVTMQSRDSYISVGLYNDIWLQDYQGDRFSSNSLQDYAIFGLQFLWACSLQVIASLQGVSCTKAKANSTFPPTQPVAHTNTFRFLYSCRSLPAQKDESWDVVMNGSSPQRLIQPTSAYASKSSSPKHWRQRCV